MYKYIKSNTEAIYAASISRIAEHINSRNLATITAFITSDDPDRPTKKQAQSRKQNRIDNQALGKAIQSCGYGYSHITGYWDEGKSGNPENAVKEETYLVVCSPTTPYEEFEKDIIALAKKYEQQAVVVWDYADHKATLWGSTDYQNYEIWDTFNNFNVDAVLSEAWSQVKNHTFVFSDTQDTYYIESATELTTGAEGPTSCRAAKYYRKRLHE